jgi:cell division protein FtsB
VKWLAIALGVVIAILQYRLWLSDSGVRELARMQGAVTQQRTQNALLVERNRQLAAEVRDLKTGMAALEERARSELGMIASNETYYQVVPAKPGPAPRPPAAQVAAR